MLLLAPLLSFSFLLEHSIAFSTISVLKTRRTTANGARPLFLTPQQGLELVQASHDLYEQDHKALQQPAPQHPKTSRSLARRLFSLPSYLWHPHAKAEGGFVLDDDGCFQEESRSDNVVYFPIVGFTYVKDGPGHSRPLSTCSNPSCRLHDETHHEPVYGWFRPPPQQDTTQKKWNAARTRCSPNKTTLRP